MVPLVIGFSAQPGPAERSSLMSAVLDKDPRIIGMLERLRTALGAGAFDVVDHWSAEFDAVGIASPRNHQVLVYIAVSADGFHAELELPARPGDVFPYKVAGRHSDMSFEKL